MERRFDEVLTIEGNFVAKGKISCKVLRVMGDFYLLGGELYCQELYIDGDAYIRGRIYLNQEGASPSGCKVVIEGSLFCDGVVAAHGGEITINEDATITSIARLRHSRVKVMNDLTAEYLDCSEITVGGEVNIKWGMLDAKGRVYVLRDLNAFDITTNHNNIYCGGKLMANRYSVGDVFEDVTCWKTN